MDYNLIRRNLTYITNILDYLKLNKDIYLKILSKYEKNTDY